MIGIMLFGRVFIYLREKFGYITTSLVHMGADIAVLTIAMLILYYLNFKDDSPKNI